jgi:hypothetical protein
MRKLICVAVAALAVAIPAATAAADTSTTVVGVAPCVFAENGSATAPAGSEITFRLGWGARSSGLVLAFLRDETTTAAVDGTPIANPESYWGPIERASVGTDSVSQWVYPTDITLGVGESVTLTMDVTLAHPLSDGYTVAPAGSIFGGHNTCTVTGV